METIDLVVVVLYLGMVFSLGLFLFPPTEVHRRLFPGSTKHARLGSRILTDGNGGEQCHLRRPSRERLHQRFLASRLLSSVAPGAHSGGSNPDLLSSHPSYEFLRVPTGNGLVTQLRHTPLSPL